MTNYNKKNSLELIAIHFVKELKNILSDKGAMLILIGAMIIYPIIYSIGYYHETLTNLPIGIVDLDHTAASRKYSNMIDASSEVNVTLKPFDLKEAQDIFFDNKISGIVLIPKGFQKDVLAGRQANVAIYTDGSYFLKYKNVFLATSYSNAYFSGGIAVKRYMAEGKSFKQALANSNPLSIQTHILYNPSSAYGSFIMPGIILIIIQQTLLIGIGLLGGSFSESKESPFLLSLEKRTKEVIPYLIGKSGAYLLISLINVAIAVILVHSWFNYPDKADLLNIMMLLFPYLLSVIILGIGISTFFKHRESAIVFMVFLSPIALFLSGVSWPTSAMPQWIVFLSDIMPSTTAVPAYLRLRTMGVDIHNVKTEILSLYAQTGIYAFLTIIYFFIRLASDKNKHRKQLQKGALSNI